MYWSYLKYVCRHKWFVFLACAKRGLIWRGIKHDMSKFLPSEFLPYAIHFSGGIQQGRNKTGYYKPTNTGDPAFDRAWFYHQKRNDHHWQYWTIPESDPVTAIPLDMPEVCCREMVCDWIGAGMAQGTPDTQAWYDANKDKLILHPDSRARVERLLTDMGRVK